MIEHWHAQLAHVYSQTATVPRIILIHPQVMQPHRALQALPTDALYIRFEGAKLNAAVLEQQFTMLVGGAALKADQVIILDEVDRAETKPLAGFIADFLLKRASNACIVLLSRTVLNELLADDRVNGYIQFLPTNEDMMLTSYAEPPAAKHRLEVWAFGRGYALINGDSITNWDGLLPRMLFYFLVDRGMVIRPDIFHTFWSDLPAKEATNVFHVTKRKVNELLKVDLTVYESSFYRINPEIDLRYDVSLFNRYLQESMGAEGEERRSLLLKAVALYRAPLLYNLTYDWARRRSAEMSQAYADALSALGELAAADGAEQEAFIWYLRAFQQQPERSEVVEQLLRLGTKLGYHDNAKSVFSQHVGALNGDAPEDVLTELYEALG